MINRRDTLSALIAMGISPLGLTQNITQHSDVNIAHNTNIAAASAARLANGDYALVLMDAKGALLGSISLPQRGHGMAWEAQTAQGVIFGRRPGYYAMIWQWTGATISITHQISAAQDRHFFGHGVYSYDGRWLYATEQNIKTHEGLIGIYDVQRGYQRVDEMPTHGIGPHEIQRSADGRWLVVCNGGIKTHPDHDVGRAKLNLETMRSSIACLNADNLSIANQWETPSQWHQLSLRHLAIDPTNVVWIGGQYQGDTLDNPPLLARLELARTSPTLELIELPPLEQASLRHYIASVSVDKAAVYFAAPKADKLVVVDQDSLAPHIERISQVTGVGCARDAIFLTGAGGVWAQYAEGEILARRRTPIAFDNHLMTVI